MNVLTIKYYLLFVIVFQFVIEGNLLAQNYDYNDYIEHQSFTRELSKEFLNYSTKKHSIKTMTEWRFELDSNGNYIDSAILYSYTFDKLGQVIKEKYCYNKNNNKFKSISYNFNEEGVPIDTIFENPYPVVESNVLDGVYVLRISTYCEYRNYDNKITMIDIDFDEYEYDLTLSFFYKNRELYDFIEVIYKGKEYEHRFEYTYYKRYQY